VQDAESHLLKKGVPRVAELNLKKRQRRQEGQQQGIEGIIEGFQQIGIPRG
jgi:hypothetical protein